MNKNISSIYLINHENMYVKVSRGFRPSCKNRGVSALRGFCPTTNLMEPLFWKLICSMPTRLISTLIVHTWRLNIKLHIWKWKKYIIFKKYYSDRLDDMADTLLLEITDLILIRGLCAIMLNAWVPIAIIKKKQYTYIYHIYSDHLGAPTKLYYLN